MRVSMTTSFDWQRNSLVESGTEHRPDEGQIVFLPEIDHSEPSETSNRPQSLNKSRMRDLEQKLLRRIHPNWADRVDASGLSIGNVVSLPLEYRDRIADLKEIAEEEGIQTDPQSVQYFARFIESQGFPMRVGALFLLDNGTYAAVWRNDQWRLNLTFHSDGTIEYVLLNREAENPDGEADRVDLEGFSDLRDRLKLEPLLRA